MDIKKILFICGLAAGITSCVSESPFEMQREGSVRMNVTLGSKLTRAIAEDEQTALEQSCVVYISGTSGLMHKWEGLGNVPASLPMKYGDYTAEAWAGDSVPASFTQRFFKAKPLNFSVADGEAVVSLKCNIANVVVSVDGSNLPADMIGEYKVIVANSRNKSLEFSGETLSQKGYFMMPWDDKANAAESTLSYTVEGTSAEGKEFSLTKELTGVAQAHEYRLVLEASPAGFEGGGAFINVTVDETELLIDDNIDILGKPVVSGDGFDISQPFAVEYPELFPDVDVITAAFGGIVSLELKLDSKVVDQFKDVAPNGVINFITGGQTALNAISTKIKFIPGEKTPSGRIWERIVFSADFLNSLPSSVEPYEFVITAEDNSGIADKVAGKKGSATLTIVNVIPPVEPKIDESDFMAVRSTSVSVNVTLNDDVENARILYREVGVSEWNLVELTRASYSVVLPNLKPGTLYEFKGVGSLSGQEIESPIGNFKTETTFSIVNGSFEEWSTYSASTMLGTKNVILPGKEGDKLLSAWGSGNEGAATANKVLTDKTAELLHSGAYAAKLETKAAVGVIAAGNIFYGYYEKTDGTDGVLQLGREYDGSHPSALQFWANYRPGSGVKIKSGNESLVGDLKSGGTDIGQVYVALTTEKVQIRTKASDRKLFTEDDPVVLAYGQITWNEAFGPDGALGLVNIPLKYKDSAKITKPRYLVIVASASKYGDFYSGAEGSVMYLDDFELVY